MVRTCHARMQDSLDAITLAAQQRRFTSYSCTAWAQLAAKVSGLFAPQAGARAPAGAGCLLRCMSIRARLGRQDMYRR